MARCLVKTGRVDGTRNGVTGSQRSVSLCLRKILRSPAKLLRISGVRKMDLLGVGLARRFLRRTVRNALMATADVCLACCWPFGATHTAPWRCAALQQLSHSVKSTLGVGGQVAKHRPSFGLRREEGASVDVLHAGRESPSAYLGPDAAEAGYFAVALPVA